MTDDNVEKLVRSLDRIATLLAASFADNLPDADLGRKAERLASLGFTHSQIAQVLDSTANSVGVALHRTRNTKKKAPRRAKGKQR